MQPNDNGPKSYTVILQADNVGPNGDEGYWKVRDHTGLIAPDGTYEETKTDDGGCRFIFDVWEIKGTTSLHYVSIRTKASLSGKDQYLGLDSLGGLVASDSWADFPPQYFMRNTDGHEWNPEQISDINLQINYGDHYSDYFLSRVYILDNSIRGKENPDEFCVFKLAVIM